MSEVRPEPWGDFMRMLIEQHAMNNSPGAVMDWRSVIMPEMTMPNHWDWLEEYLYQMPDKQFYDTAPIQNMGPQGEFWTFGA